MKTERENRLCILNPNSDVKMGEEIEKIVEATVAPRTKFFVCNNTSGPLRLKGPEDEAAAASGMLEIAKRNEDSCDALVVACTRDPNLDALRQAVKRPVLGAAESAFRMATILGSGFSLIQTSVSSIAAKRFLIRKYGFSSFCTSVRGFDAVPGSDITAELVAESEKAIREDGAEVIILGGIAGIGHYNVEVQKRLSVPVIDGLRAAVLLAGDLLVLGVSTSKTGLYSR